LGARALRYQAPLGIARNLGCADKKVDAYQRESGNVAAGRLATKRSFRRATGLPANITNGASANSVDRPDAAGGGITLYLSGYRSGIHQYLDRAAFTPIPVSSLSGEQVRPGNLSNNAVRIPGLENLDATLAKTLFVTERFRLQLRADAFNTLNHTNLSGLVTTINTNTFGQLTTATARTLQLGARLNF